LVGRGWAVVFARAGHDVRLFDVTEKKIAVARIWNGSTEASIAQLLVEFSYLSFGVGTSLHHIGVSKINLGVKGAPDQPSFATHQWLTPPTSGHYCVQVSLNWADDVNPNNNLGQTNTDVITAQSPAEFEFQLRNSSKRWEQYRFEIDAYTIPAPLPCSQREPLPTSPRGSRLAPGKFFASLYQKLADMWLLDMRGIDRFQFLHNDRQFCAAALTDYVGQICSKKD
jgi:hypothetical protein